MSSDANTDPKQLLTEMHTTNQEIKQIVARLESLVESGQELRLDLGSQTNMKRILAEISQKEPVCSSKIESVNGDVTRQLYKLYIAGYVNRDESCSPMEYWISQKGRLALESVTKQKKIADSDENQEWETPQHPWEKCELNHSQWRTLELVNEYDGRPSPADIDGEYRKKTNANSSEHGYAVSARLSELYDGGFVGRTPNRPYIYWLTERGKDVLNEYGD